MMTDDCKSAAELGTGACPYEKKDNWPISKYIGQFPNGKWEFIKEFDGTLKEAGEEAIRLQMADEAAQYRIWDCR